LGFIDLFSFYMKTLLPIASGKGGVGKTVITANLGVSLAERGKTVILVDLDLGGSNLHTCLGVKNTHPGIGNYINNRENGLESFLIETEIPRLFLVPGDSLIPGTANLQYFIKRRIIKDLENLVADYILLDLGGGTAFNTIDFFLSSSTGIIVTMPQTTAILNAYSFIKSAVFRMLYRSFPSKSGEREIISSFTKQKFEGESISFKTLIDRLQQYSSQAGETARNQLRSFFPRIVLNMGRSNKDIALGSKLREIVRKNLDLEVEYVGFVTYDELVNRSILERVPTFKKYPQSSFSKNISTIEKKLSAFPFPKGPRLYEADEDLISLVQDHEQ
jgi:flagellar biosynthesis protein FlhG